MLRVAASASKHKRMYCVEKYFQASYLSETFVQTFPIFFI
jgi:hypothetical protein